MFELAVKVTPGEGRLGAGLYVFSKLLVLCCVFVMAQAVRSGVAREGTHRFEHLVGGRRRPTPHEGRGGAQRFEAVEEKHGVGAVEGGGVTEVES